MAKAAYMANSSTTIHTAIKRNTACPSCNSKPAISALVIANTPAINQRRPRVPIKPASSHCTERPKPNVNTCISKSVIIRITMRTILPQFKQAADFSIA